MIYQSCTILGLCTVRQASAILSHFRARKASPASSGYKERCHGIVGSTNGLGVLSSMKIGRLIATLEPLLLLMLAVRVL
jgi:hypothetical protein